MRSFKPSVLAFIVVLGAASAAHAIIIQGTELPSYTPVTNQLALTHGATFSSAMPFCTFGTNGNNVDGIYGTDPSFSPMFSNAAYYAPIEITFVDMSNGVSPAFVSGTINAVFGDGGGDTDGIRVRAFDFNNNLLATNTALTVSWGNISITANNIYRLVFDQSGLGAGTSDTFLDWIDYPTPVPVPAPSATALLLTGALISSRRRRP